MNPFDRYRIYGVWPKKMIVHILLLITATWYMFENNEVVTAILDPSVKTWFLAFLDMESDI